MPNELSKEFFENLIEKWASWHMDENHKTPTETHRWLFCYENTYPINLGWDCACCLMDRPIEGCGCICHERIKSLAKFLMDNLLGG
jgi:hypothetical protein